MSDHELILGDCLDPLRGLASLADKSVDHVICDPPYGEQIYGNMRTNAARAGFSQHAQRADAGYSGLMEEDIAIAGGWMARLARRWVVVFTDSESVHVWQRALVEGGARHIRVGAFVKANPMPQITGDRPAQGFDAIIIAHAILADGKRWLRWNGGGKAGVWSATSARTDGQEVIHPTQKPLSLMEELIADFTDPGELICDPFAGGGTTLVACKRLGRRAIGWEKDATFWERAVRRLENTKQQYELVPRGPKPRQQKMVLP